MTEKQYYSIRTGRNQNPSQIDSETLLRHFRNVYNNFIDKYYFQEAFGYFCVDDGKKQGELGIDLELSINRKLRKTNWYPIEDKCLDYSEDDLFDIIEFLYDWISKPINGRYHDFYNCGWHYHTFDKSTGQQEFRVEINEFLRDYKNGYELSNEGEILELPEPGLEPLLTAELPSYDPDNVEIKVLNARHKFLHRSTLDDKLDALKTLADVLEFLRNELKGVLITQHEQDLFNIANNYGIRHHNLKQKTDYEKAIWYDWIFYYYLATINTSLQLIKRGEKTKGDNLS